MRKTLIATSALAFAGAVAAGQASAADMMSVGVGGYMEQWFGYANRDDKDAKGMSEEGGWDAQGDAEIHFRGSLESDSGLKFTVHVELEGDQGSNAIDESYARVSGEFGQIEFGARDHAMVRMHQGISDVGVGLNAGDTQKWVPGAYLETSGHAIGNARKLNYLSPRVSGLQLGVSYAPDDSSQAPTSAPSDNDNAAWGAGLNFKQEVGDLNVTFSLGHANRGMKDMKVSYMPAMAPATGAGSASDTRLSQAQYAAHMTTVGQYRANSNLDLAKGQKTLSTLTDGDALATAVSNARMAENAIDASTSSMMKGDDATYTNAGVGVSFGAFTFNIAYATADGGAYRATEMPVKMTPAEMVAHADALGATATAYDESGTAVTGGNTAAYIIDTTHMVDGEPEALDSDADTAGNQVRNSTTNETWMASKVVEDTTKNYDVWGVSISYSDGPMSVSLGHMTHEEEAGGERTATMLSASYALAPGVSWSTSIFGVEDDTSAVTHKDGKPTGDMMNEGTGFVTGIKIGF